MPVRHIEIAPGTVVLLVAPGGVAADAFRALGLPEKGPYAPIRVLDLAQVSGRFEPGMPTVRALVYEYEGSLTPEQHKALGFLAAHNVPLEKFTMDDMPLGQSTMRMLPRPVDPKERATSLAQHAKAARAARAEAAREKRAKRTAKRKRR